MELTERTKFYRVVGKVGSRYRTTLKHRSTLYFSSFPFSILRRERKKKRERERGGEKERHLRTPQPLVLFLFLPHSSRVPPPHPLPEPLFVIEFLQILLSCSNLLSLFDWSSKNVWGIEEIFFLVDRLFIRKLEIS